MADAARVDSIDSLRQFRVALLNFAASADLALGDAESELRRTLMWLENEQRSHWQIQIRQNSMLLGRAKEALRMKILYKDSAGRTPDAMEEKQAVRLAQQRLEHAEKKAEAVKKYSTVLHREIQLYKGSVQRFSSTLQRDIPAGAAMLAGMIESLQGYADLTLADTNLASPTQPRGGEGHE